MAIKHIFPIVLEGAQQSVTGAGSSTAWDGLTSYIEVDSSAAGETITIGNGTVTGSLVTVIKKGSANEILVDATTDFDSDQGSITLSEDGEMCTLFWNNVSWRVFNQAEGGMTNDIKKGTDRWVHEEYFLQRPALNADIDQAYTVEVARAANVNFEVTGANMTTALCTFDHEYGGVTLTTAGADNDAAIIQPHADSNQSYLGVAGVFDTQNEVEFATSITTGASIANTAFFAGLKLTAVADYTTDADSIYFLYASNDDAGTLTTNANLHVIASRGGADKVFDLGIAVAADTKYDLRIQIDSARKAAVFVDGVQYALVGGSTSGGDAVTAGTTRSAAMTDNAALKPFVGVQALTGSAKAIRVHYEKISRKVN